MGPLATYFHQMQMQRDQENPVLTSQQVCEPECPDPTKIGLSDIMSVVKFLLTVRTQAQLLHWGTYKFSTHMALADLYDGLDKLTDEFAELLMGINDSLDFSTQQISHVVEFSVEPKEFISQVIEIFKSSRSLFFDTSVQNKFDEILGLLNTTKYKIERLS